MKDVNIVYILRVYYLTLHVLNFYEAFIIKTNSAITIPQSLKINQHPPH